MEITKEEGSLILSLVESVPIQLSVKDLDGDLERIKGQPIFALKQKLVDFTKSNDDNTPSS